MIKIKFSTENAAFEEHPATEISRIFEVLAKKMRDGDFDENTPIWDINGNWVGSMKIEEK